MSTAPNALSRTGLNMPALRSGTKEMPLPGLALVAWYPGAAPGAWYPM